MVAEPRTNPFKIYFCTALVGRAWQLERIMAHNLLAMLMCSDFVRWVIAFCSSEDEPHARAASQLAEGCSWCQVLYSQQPRKWHASKCKNAAHRWALELHELRTPTERAFIMNLDADNAIPVEFIPDVLLPALRRLKLNQTLSCTNPSVQRTTGRIGAWATTWAQMRGYDEDLQPMGYQDIDLLKRCKQMQFGQFPSPDPRVHQG